MKTSRAQNVSLIREMLITVNPEHLTDDELAVLAGIVAAAYSRLLAADNEPAPVLQLMRPVRIRHKGE